MKEFAKAKLFLMVFPALLLWSCAESKKEEIPAGVLDRTTFANVVADIHVADASVDMMKLESIEDIIKHKKSFNESVLKHYNINDSIFNISYNYYSRDLEDFGAFYDEVIEIMTQREAAYNKETEAEQKKDDAQLPKQKE